MSEGNYTLITDSVQWLEFKFFQDLQRQQQAAKYAKPQDNYTALGRRVEWLAADILADRGHPVHLTTHKCPWDLWCGGLKVEVKGARWKGHRYQAALRNQQADVVLLACIRGHRVVGWFILPQTALVDRSNIAIWTREPRKYGGRWAAYYNRWDVLDNLIRQAGPCPEQLGLGL